MATKKLPPFQNVLATGTAVLPDIPQGNVFEKITLKLGGTALTKAMLAAIRLTLGGKEIWSVTGAHLDDINEYYRLTANAAYLSLWFANPRGKNLAERMIGAIDTSDRFSDFALEVDIAGATAPTLEAYSTEVAPIDEDKIYKGLIRTLTKGTHVAGAAQEHSLAINLGTKKGALVRGVHMFHANITQLQVTKDSYYLINKGVNAQVQFDQNEFGRTTQAGLLSADFTLEDYDSLAVPTLRKDGAPAAFEFLATTSAADTIIAYSDLLRTHGNI